MLVALDVVPVDELGERSVGGEDKDKADNGEDCSCDDIPINVSMNDVSPCNCCDCDCCDGTSDGVLELWSSVEAGAVVFVTI